MSKKLIHNSAFGLAASLITTFGGFASSLVLARTLGVEGAGVVAYGIWISTTAVTLASAGVPFTLARYLPELTARGDEAEAKRLNAFLLKPYLLFSFAAPALMLGYAFYKSGRPEADGDLWLWIMIASCALTQSVADFARGYMRGMQKFDNIVMASFIATLCQPVAIALAGWRFGPTGALAGYAIGNCIPSCLILAVPWPAEPITSDLRWRVLRCAGFRWAGEITAAFVWSRLEVFFLHLWCGSASVGLFSAGLTLANFAAQLPIMLTWGLIPHFSERVARKDFIGLRRDLATGTRVIAFILLPMCLGAAAIMPALIPLLFGPNFAGAVGFSILLVCGAGLAAATAVVWNVIWAMERTDVELFISLVGALIAVVADFALIPNYGVFGAAVSRVAAQTMVSALAVVFLIWRLGVAPPFADLGRILACALLCALAARATLLLAPGPLGLPPAVAMGVAVYFLSARWLKALPEEDIGRFRSLAALLPGALASPAHRILDMMAARRA